MNNKYIGGKTLKYKFDLDQKIIIIEEDNVSKGDYIDLNKESSIVELLAEQFANENYQSRIIDEFKKSNEYLSLIDDKNQLDNLNKNLENIKEEAIKDFKLSKEFEDLKNSKYDLEQKLNNSKEKINDLNNRISEIKEQEINKFKSSPEYVNLIEKNANLNNNLKNLENELKEKQLYEKVRIIEEFKDNEEYKTLVKDLENYKTKSIQLQTELENSYDKHINEFKKTEDYKELEGYKNIYLNKRNANSKILGEDLENECKRNFEINFQQIDDIKFEKTTTAINGKKPDFKFTVFTNNEKKNEIGSVILEMKNNNGEDKSKKNESFFEILEKNRINFKAEFALLVTELESDDNFAIKKAQGYSNIFITRPEHFIYVLVLFRLIYKRMAEIKEALSNQIDNSKIVDAINSFNDFKNDLFQKSLENINNKVEDISKYAEVIKNNSIKILESVRVIKETHLKTVENKIEQFSKKLLK